MGDTKQEPKETVKDTKQAVKVTEGINPMPKQKSTVQPAQNKPVKVAKSADGKLIRTDY